MLFFDLQSTAFSRKKFRAALSDCTIFPDRTAAHVVRPSCTLPCP
jgi:hypothetical protein